ncbi:ATP-grasp domain-containing protein [Bacteroides uniformis]|uniref:ATP-grasp domain-containing protein n=1 Tax=Bacteroides uniformis TaxID=820 RepID=UPI0039B534A4
MKNILITSAGKRVALTKAFKETTVRFDSHAKVFTTDMNPSMAPAAYVSDKCFEVPRVTDKDYPELLLKLCVDNEIGMVVPTIDTELIVLAHVKEMFASKGVHVIISDTSFITICRDKRNTGEFFERHHIRIPASIDKLHPTFPMFAKPYDGSLSTNLHYIKNEAELTPDILNDPKLMFMEYIDKAIYKEYTVDMYYGKDNRLKCLVPRERIEIRAGEINKGTTAKNGLVAFLKERLEHIEGCVGCICLQLFYHAETNDVVGIEINPRFGGGYPLSYAAGGNFPEFLIREYFRNEALAYADDWKDNLLMLRYDDAIFV